MNFILLSMSKMKEENKTKKKKKGSRFFIQI